MRIIVARPPNFDQIIARYPEAAIRHGMYFSYGDAVYNPDDMPLRPELKAHEAVHCQRQLEMDGGPDAWWTRYLSEPLFVLEEELLAHRAEYRAAKSFADRRRALEVLDVAAQRLAGPLYGHLISYREARHLITATVHMNRVDKLRRHGDTGGLVA